MQKLLIFFSVSCSLALGGYWWMTQPDVASHSNKLPDLRYASTHLSPMRFEAPTTLDFAGEAVPMHREEVALKLQKELNQKIQHSSGTHQLYRRVLRYKTLFQRILEEEGVPTDFFYLSMAESALSNAISPVGAAGFWQFMPTTARIYHLEVSAEIDERFDPVKATYAAARYLKDLHKELNSWTLVAAAYNMGPTGLQRSMARQDGKTYFDLELNRETAQYLYRILSNKCIVEQPARYGYDLSQVSTYAPIHYKYVLVKEDIHDIASFAAQHGLTLDQFLTVNPWIKTDRLLTHGQTHRVQIPLSKDFFAAELKVSRLTDAVSTEADEPESLSVKPDSIHRVAES